ncbi:MAG: LysR family transcriptional regulator [Acidobacteriota bacterium]|nr:LysR family transcriptional regulator [Acidobacteriota bacterium]
MRLNYHHLHYFWAVAKDGNLTRTAAHLHVSQSALSAQIRSLEDDLGQALFERTGRSLQLTEAGRLALTYAETIFAAGNELAALMKGGEFRKRQTVRIGAVATLSRNFQENFVRPLLQMDDIEIVLQSGALSDLLTRLSVHGIDLVLSNRRVHRDATHPWQSHRIARQPVSLVGKPRRSRRAFIFPVDLGSNPLLLPSMESEIRAGFDQLCEQHRVSYRILAEVDDMAMLRLLARDTGATALVPTVVVQDELKSGALVEYCVVPQLFEDFYAITVKRHFQSPILRTLLRRREDDVLSGVSVPL